MDEGRTDQLVFFAFDLLYLNGESTAQLPLIKRKERLERLFNKEAQEGLRYSEHVLTDGPRFREHACKLGLEGIISKRIDRPYAPNDRGLWVKSEVTYLTWTEDNLLRQVSYQVSARTSPQDKWFGRFPIRLILEEICAEEQPPARPRHSLSERSRW